MVNPITDIESSLEIGFSNEVILLISLLGFTILFAALACLCHFSPSQANYDEKEGKEGNNPEDEYNRLLEDADVATLNRAQRKARAKLLMKKNRRLANEQQRNGGNVDANRDGGGGANDGAAIVAVDAVEDQQEPDNNNNEGPKLSRKERQKAAKEEERLYRKEYSQEIRKLKLKDDMYRKEAKEKLLKEKKDLLQYERQEMIEKKLTSWKYMFGDVITTDKDILIDAVTVDEFLKELKESQVINLKDTANRFDVPIEELIKRLRQLEKEGRIDHGIIDKNHEIYFFVSIEDMQQVSKFINEKGVVTLDDITTEVSRYILEKISCSSSSSSSSNIADDEIANDEKVQ